MLTELAVPVLQTLSFVLLLATGEIGLVPAVCWGAGIGCLWIAHLRIIVRLTPEDEGQ